MKITFTFSSEEVDCGGLAESIGINTERDEDNKVTASYSLNNEDIRRVDQLKRLRIEDLLGNFSLKS